MFKKLKDKIEEVRQAPSLAQTADINQSTIQTDLHYSPFSSPKPDESSINKDKDNGQPLIDLDDSGPSFSTQTQQFTVVEEDEISNSDVTSSMKSTGNFQSVDLSEVSASSTPIPSRTRTSSESSYQGEMNPPSYAPPPYLFNPQSDTESISEFEDSSPILEQIPKEQIFEAFRKVRIRYQKYRGKYAELIKAYKEVASEKEKIRTKLTESQDKSLRRIEELREEISLDKQAKNDLEATYRIMLEEKDELINVLHTQVRLLKDGVTNDVLKNSENNSNELVMNSITNAAAGDTLNQIENTSENSSLLEKNNRLESILLKCKENMKTNKERISQLMQEKNDLVLKLDDVQKQLESNNINNSEVSNVEKRLEELEVHKNEELYLLNVKIEEITKEKEALQQQIDDNCRELAEKHEMQARIDELTAARVNLEEKLLLNEKFIEENETLNRSLVEMENQWTIKCKEFCQKADENSRLLDSSQKENDELKSKLDELKVDDENHNAIIEALKTEVKELRLYKEKMSNFEENVKRKFDDLITLTENLKNHDVIGSRINDDFIIEKSSSVENICGGFTNIIQILKSELETLQYKYRHAADFGEAQTTKLEENDKVNEKLEAQNEEFVREIHELHHRLKIYDEERESVLENAALCKQQVTNATLELQKQQFACNNLTHVNDELHRDIEDLQTQITMFSDQLNDKDREISQLVTEKIAIEESLGLQLQDLKASRAEEGKSEEESESLSLLLQKFESDAKDKDSKLNQTLDELQMERVMRQSSSESEQSWMRKFEDSELLVKNFQMIIEGLEEEKRRNADLLEEQFEKFETMRKGYEFQLQETSERLALELKSFKEGEQKLQREFRLLHEQQDQDKTSIVDELQKLHQYKYELEEALEEKNKELDQCLITNKEFLEFGSSILNVSIENLDSQIVLKVFKEKYNEFSSAVEILSKDKEELQEKLENYTQEKDEEIQGMKLIQVEKLTELKNKTSESINCLKGKIKELKSDMKNQKTEFDKCNSEAQLLSNTQIIELQKRFEDEKKKLENELSDKENLIENFKSEQFIYNEKELELNDLIKKYKNGIEKIKNECQQEMESYEEQMKLLQVEKEDLLDKFTKTTEERDHLNEQFRTLQLELSEKSSSGEADVESLLQKNIDKEKALWDLTNEYENCKKLLEKTINEKHELQTSTNEKIEELSTQIASKDNQIEEIQNKFVDSNERYESEKMENEKSRHEIISKLEEELTTTSSSLKSVIEEKCMLENELKEIRIQFGDEKDVLRKLIDDNKEEHKIKWEQRENDFNNDMQTKLQDLKKKAESKLAQIKKQLQSNADKIVADSKVEVIQLKETISNLMSTHQDEIENVQVKAHSVLNVAKTEFEERIKGLEMQLQMARDDAHLQVQSELMELTEANSNLVKSHQIELENMQSSADRVLDDLKIGLEEKIQILENQLKSEDIVKADQKMEVTLLQNEIYALKSHQTEIENLQLSATNDLTLTKAELEEKIANLEGELESTKKTSLIELENIKQESNDGLEKLKQTITSLEEQIKIAAHEKEIEIEKYAQLENRLQLEREAMQKDIDKKNAQIDESLLLSQENTSEKEKLLEKNKLEMKKLVQQLKKRENEISELKKQIPNMNSTVNTNENLDEIKVFYEQKLVAKDEEQTEKIKQLVIDFNTELEHKEQEHEEMMSTTVDKLRNEKARMEKDYQDQMKEILGDLNEKESYLENLITTTKAECEEKDKILESKAKEYERNLEKLKIEHSQKVTDIESKGKSVLNKRLKENAQRYDEEIRGLTNEWNEERKLPINENGDQQSEKLEKQSLLTMAVIESNTGSNQLLRREVLSQSVEMTQNQNEMQRLKSEITNLQQLLENSSRAQGPLLTEPTQLEYLRNILFEYMMGRQTTTLAKVIATVVKFTEFQTQKVLEKEESRHTVLSNLLQN